MCKNVLYICLYLSWNSAARDAGRRALNTSQRVYLDGKRLQTAARDKRRNEDKQRGGPAVSLGRSKRLLIFFYIEAFFRALFTESACIYHADTYIYLSFLIYNRDVSQNARDWHSCYHKWVKHLLYIGFSSLSTRQWLRLMGDVCLIFYTMCFQTDRRDCPVSPNSENIGLQIYREGCTECIQPRWSLLSVWGRRNPILGVW